MIETRWEKDGKYRPKGSPEGRSISCTAVDDYGNALIRYNGQYETLDAKTARDRVNWEQVR